MTPIIGKVNLYEVLHLETDKKTAISQNVELILELMANNVTVLACFALFFSFFCRQLVPFFLRLSRSDLGHTVIYIQRRGCIFTMLSDESARGRIEGRWGGANFNMCS